MSSNADSSSRALPQKLLVYYEELFQNKEPWVKRPLFWDEFFLLKVKGKTLYESLNVTLESSATSQEDMKVVEVLFEQCVKYLDDMSDHRVNNAFDTLILLFTSVFRKRYHDFANEILSMFGPQFEPHFAILYQHLRKHLCCDSNNNFRFKSLLIVTSILTATDAIHSNKLISILLKSDLCDAFVQCIACTQDHEDIILYAIFSLGLICQYTDMQVPHPYQDKISRLTDERAIHSLLVTLTQSYEKCFVYLSARAQQSQTSSWSNSIFHWIPGVNGHVKLPRFIQQILSEYDPIKLDDLRANRLLSCLLLLSQLISNNRHFLTCLIPGANSMTFFNRQSIKCYSEQRPIYYTDGSVGYIQETKMTIDKHMDGTLPVRVDASEGSNGNCDDVNVLLRKKFKDALLFPQYLSLCSVFSQNTMDERNLHDAKLVLQDIKKICLDDLMMARLHDPDFHASVSIYHRSTNTVEQTEDQPFVTTLLDVCLLIQKNNLRRDLPVEIYLLALDILFIVVHYQRRCKVRSSYPFIKILSEMLVFLQFLATHRSHFVNMRELSILVGKVVRFLNYFVSFAQDNFLYGSAYYEYLYELVRCHELFDKMEYMLKENQELNPGMRISVTLDILPVEKYLSTASSATSLYAMSSAPDAKLTSDTSSLGVSNSQIFNATSGGEKKACGKVVVDLSLCKLLYEYFYEKIRAWCEEHHNDRPRAIEIHSIIETHFPEFKGYIENIEFDECSSLETNDNFMKTITRMMLSDHKNDMTRYILQVMAID